VALRRRIAEAVAVEIGVDGERPLHREIWVCVVDQPVTVLVCAAADLDGQRVDSRGTVVAVTPLGAGRHVARRGFASLDAMGEVAETVAVGICEELQPLAALSLELQEGLRCPTSREPDHDSCCPTQRARRHESLLTQVESTRGTVKCQENVKRFR